MPLHPKYDQKRLLFPRENVIYLFLKRTSVVCKLVVTNADSKTLNLKQEFLLFDNFSRLLSGIDHLLNCLG